MRIAIIGSGISGLSAAYLLDKTHDVTVFEAEEYVGGHVHTVPVIENNETIWIDTGFIVCNPKNYPKFFKLMQELNVTLQKSNMSFSVNIIDKNLEYNGTSLNGLFAQRKNLLNLKFLQMLRDIYIFNKNAKQYAKNNKNELTLKQFVISLNLRKYFSDFYLAPMIGAIWSNDKHTALDMPALFVCKFLDNHGMLNVNDRPQWYCVEGGSHMYIKELTSRLKKPVLLNSRVTDVVREDNIVKLKINGNNQSFDKVIFATHSDQALKILGDPTMHESTVLSGLLYQKNGVVLHTDVSLLPTIKRAWASWNYKIINSIQDRVSVTYNMNILQNLKTKKTYCVSLNQTDQIDPTCIIAKYTYDHPIYNYAAMQSQLQHEKISGVNNTYYCGAYWGSGFHEDGLNSGIAVAKQIAKDDICAAQFFAAG